MSDPKPMLDVAALKAEGMKIYNELGCTYPPTPMAALMPNPKVVILGQDPYPTGACGKAFVGENKGSAGNIIRCILNSYGEDDPSKVDFLKWEEQGVMLLNTYFSLGKSPKWIPFTEKILRQLRQCVVLAWGSDAQKICRRTLHSSNKMITFSHPSPLYQNTLTKLS